MNHANAVSPRAALLTSCAIFALVCYPPLLSLHYEGMMAVFKYFATDVYYYLAVADHSTHAAFFTLDGAHPVNGFHPAWQWYLTLAFRWATSTAEQQLLLCFASSILFTAVGTALFGLALLRVTSSPSLALLAAVPGFYFWLAPSARPEYGAQWTYVNGMESPLSILVFGAIAYLLFARGWLQGAIRPARSLALSGLLTLATLSRLDDIFLFVPFLAYLTLGEKSWRARLVRGVWAGIVPLIAIGGYLLWNLTYAGTALPLSGVLKSQGPIGGFLRNAYAVYTMLLPMGDLRGTGPVVWGGEAWRVLQMLLPALAALAWLVLRRPSDWRATSDEPGYLRAMLCLLSAYVVIKAAYNFAFVGLWHQGHWYYAASIMIFNLLLAAWLAEGIAARTAAAHRPRRPWIAAACFVFLAVSGATFASIKGGSEAHRANYELWTHRKALDRALAERCPGCGLLAFDDGIFAYASAIPTLNGIGLMLDRQAFEAKRQGRLLPLAYERGHRLLVTLNYPFAEDLDAGNLRSRLGSYRHLRGEDLAPWRFEIAHREPATGAVFIAFEPRNSAGGG